MAKFGSLNHKLMELGLPDTWIAGTKQRLTGDLRQQIVEGFLALMPPARSNEIEHKIERLHGIKELSRFRVAFVLLLISTYENGMRHARRDDTFDLLASLNLKSEKK